MGSSVAVTTMVTWLLAGRIKNWRAGRQRFPPQSGRHSRQVPVKAVSCECVTCARVTVSSHLRPDPIPHRGACARQDVHAVVDGAVYCAGCARFRQSAHRTTPLATNVGRHIVSWSSLLASLAHTPRSPVQLLRSSATPTAGGMSHVQCNVCAPTSAHKRGRGGPSAVHFKDVAAEPKQRPPRARASRPRALLC